MKKGQVEYATRKAYEVFDRWNEVTGCIPLESSYYYEILGVIEDAVHIGIQMAMQGKIDFKTEAEHDGDGDVIKQR